MEWFTPRRQGIVGTLATILVVANLLLYGLVTNKMGPFADYTFAHRAVMGMRVVQFLFAIGMLLKLRAEESASELAQRTNRPIVSQGEYVVRKGEKAGLTTLGVILCGLGYLCLANGIIGTLLFIVLFSGGDTSPWFPVFDVLAIAFAVLFIRLGHRSFKGSRALDPGIPMSSEDRERLPGHDTLVRASGEPASTQQSTLLRPADASGQTAHDEQLLHPANEETI